MQRTWMIGLALVGLAAGGLAYVATDSSAVAQSTASQGPAAPVAAVAQTVAEAQVVPQRHAKLSFASAGTVAVVLVHEGQRVEQGQPLARLDTRALDLALLDAEARLEAARAAEQAVKEGSTPAERAEAEARVTAAQGQYSQVAGAVTDADLAAAQQALNQANTTLAMLEAGPKATDIAIARAALDRAQAAYDQDQTQLQASRDALSRSKADAEAALAQASLDLQKAQSDYSVAYWKHHRAQDGRLPASVEGQPEPAVTDYGALEQDEAFKQAGLNLQAAEQRQQQALVALDAARKAEQTGVQQAEQRAVEANTGVTTAQATLDALLQGPEPDAIAAARARVAQATADLGKLRGQQRAGGLEAAQADVAAAQAQLEQLTAPPRVSQLMGASAQVKQAEVALLQARLALEQATLTAPIDGTVAEVNISTGEATPADGLAVVVADMSAWQIETGDLTELNIVAVQPGDRVSITFDAIPDLELPGHVERIKPIGKNHQGDMTYTVVIAPDQIDPRMQWNMTASVMLHN